jgi:hypothetical protein
VIQVPAQASVFVMHESVSFRNGIDGMAALASVGAGQGADERGSLRVP